MGQRNTRLWLLMSKRIYKKIQMSRHINTKYHIYKNLLTSFLMRSIFPVFSTFFPQSVSPIRSKMLWYSRFVLSTTAASSESIVASSTTIHRLWAQSVVLSAHRLASSNRCSGVKGFRHGLKARLLNVEFFHPCNMKSLRENLLPVWPPSRTQPRPLGKIFTRPPSKVRLSIWP